MVSRVSVYCDWVGCLRRVTPYVPCVAELVLVTSRYKKLRVERDAKQQQQQQQQQQQLQTTKTTITTTTATKQQQQNNNTTTHQQSNSRFVDQVNKDDICKELCAAWKRLCHN